MHIFRRVARAHLAVPLLLLLGAGRDARAKQTAAPDSFAELEDRIAQVLEETHTPGLGIAIVSRDKVQWVAGIGTADVASGRSATPETLWRVGSTSKGFVSLAVLKLQEEGRLSLDDPVREHAPEIEFANPWDETDPVRLVHLLEHTSGFDDVHLADYANSDPKPLSLREALDSHPDSRVARWRPGTRFSYCNSGPGLAAYSVEKVTGERFEEYVQESFFDPLGMSGATYLLTPEVERRGATLYKPDGVTPFPYKHIVLRPSGALNASARDLASYLRFYLQRGGFEGRRLVSAESIARMERGASSSAARVGLESVYGLSNYPSPHGGFVFHGHDGGMEGGLAQLAYLPEHGVGYAFAINGANGAAFGRISKLVRDFLVRDLPEPALPSPATAPGQPVSAYAGYYEPASPRMAKAQFAERILGLTRLTIDGHGLRLEQLLDGGASEYVAVTDRLARRPDQSLTTLALLPVDAEDTFIVVEGQTLRRIGGWLAWGQVGLLFIAAGLFASSLVFALVWVPRYLLGRLRGGPHIGVRFWPLVSTLSLIGFAALLVGGSNDPVQRLGRVTAYSVGQMSLSVALAGTAFWGLLVVIRAARAPINRGAWWHSLLVAIACSSVALYLLYWGMIGLRSWSY